MVQHLRYHQVRKSIKNDEEEEDEQSQTQTQTQTLVFELGNPSYYRRTNPKLLILLICFCLVFLVLVFVPHFFRLYSYGVEEAGLDVNEEARSPLCASMAYGSICCDRNGFRSDICYMKGDVRTNSASSSIFVYSENKDRNYVLNDTKGEEDLVNEKIKPYTRKWETSIMDTIDELELVVKRKDFGGIRPCEVRHSLPAIVFSTGGYTGNVYHEFSDGIIPLYITSQHFNRNVVFVVVEYHEWWKTKYGEVLSLLSKYPPINFGDNRTHCFPEAIVGLRIHGDLMIDSSLMPGNKSIRDFRNVLDKAYWPRIQGLIQEEHEAQSSSPPAPALSEEAKELEELTRKPKLVILSRNGSRVIVNQNLLVDLAEEIGFEVKVLTPDRTTELAKIYRVLNSSDVMVGVHGAAMTHFLFMKPGTVFIQVIPLGTEWAAETFYGAPSRMLGLKYIGYQILPGESSLYKKYDKHDPVLRDSDSVNAKGWEFTKSIYLDGQNVKLDVQRFRKPLVQAFNYIISKRS